MNWNVSFNVTLTEETFVKGPNCLNEELEFYKTKFNLDQSRVNYDVSFYTVTEETFVTG